MLYFSAGLPVHIKLTKVNNVHDGRFSATFAPNVQFKKLSFSQFCSVKFFKQDEISLNEQSPH